MVNEDSRYNYTSRIRVLDQGVLIENERLDLPYARSLVVRSKKADTQQYAVMAGDTWANIAARSFRGRSDLWWVIAEYSGIIDPFTELKVGQILSIPQFSTAMFEALAFNMAPVSDAAQEGV